MASCYDCIHCGACSDAGDSGFSSLKEDVRECKHFKNKADFVGVVRCKDCIYNEIGNCTHSQKYDEDNYRADYFCADGTPKERGGEK